jgi:hypothetical protein
LQKRARDFLLKDVKTVEELEKLEKEDRQAADRARAENKRVDSQAAEIARVAEAQAQ